MKRKIKIPIGIKLNSIISTILIISFAIVLLFATMAFRRDNRNNINSLNAIIAKASAEKVNAISKNLLNDFLSIAKLAETKNFKHINHYFNDSSYISISIFEKKTDNFVLKKYIPNIRVMKSFDILPKNHKTNLRDILKTSESTFEGEINIRSSIESNLAILFMALPFSKGENGEINSIVIGAIDQSKILRLFDDNSVFVSFLLDETGAILAHPDKDKILNKINYSHNPLVKKMISGEEFTEQQEFTDDKGNKQLGAYSLVGIGGIGVISQVSAKKAYEATNILLKRSSLAALIVLIFSIITIYLFSQTITGPIENLVQLTKKISEGIYNIKIKSKSLDELGELATAFEKMACGLEQKERLKTTFGKFVNKELAEKALKGDLTLGGEKKKVTIFFSDIRDFTTISEKMDPIDVLSMLNSYMSIMVEIITRRGGIVDKFVGDAIMAVWGAPINRDDDAKNAVIACIEMREALLEFNKERFLFSLPSINIGMGLNTGYVIAGNMGSSEKMEYTVLGDNVNLAARIENQTKHENTDILINETTYNEVKDILDVVPCKKIKVKGRNKESFLYKVIGIRKEVSCLSQILP